MVESLLTSANIVPLNHTVYGPRPNLTIIRIVDCLNNYNDGDFENTALVGLLLSVSHISNSETGRVSTTSARNFYSGAGANSRVRMTRTSDSKAYDRILFFADLNSRTNGQCFAVICNFTRDSKKFFLPSLATQEGVGNIFVIEEPKLIENMLGRGTSMPILEHHPRGGIAIGGLYREIVPQISLIAPPENETLYFAQHHKPIKISMARLDTECCSGTFCDRALVQRNVTQKCACFHTSSNRSAHVIEMTVRISCPDQFPGVTKGHIMIHQHRSWRTSKLFVPDDQWINCNTQDMDQNLRLRTCIKTIVDFVNGHGGWTIVGWCRTGEVRDAAQENAARTADNTLAAATSKTHISYLYPSEMESYNKEWFDSMKFVP